MKFLVDAHLPQRLSRFLEAKGHDAIHTKDLPEQNFTSDETINSISVREKRVVVTKDADFVNSFFLKQEPFKLLLITTGNIRNAELETLFQTNFEQLVQLLEGNSFVEMNRDSIIIHQ